MPILVIPALAACGGPAREGPAAVSGPVDDNAPGWARAGDTADDEAHRFICQGEGASEEDALTTAHALCDDKICKLCGVEVESIVQTEETLTGVDLQRRVIERCRRVRQAPPEVLRKSVDCAPEGCRAWIQIRYTRAAQEQECERLSDEDFADPEACQATIDELKGTPGFSAASFRTRVALMDRAIEQCAGIDVRPTPLMTALEAKLQVAMTTFNSPGSGAPRHLRAYWLAPHPPLWAEYRENDSFVGRLQLLRGYLQHKALIMDVIEAAKVELDLPGALERLRAAMAAVKPDLAYGTKQVQMLALDQLSTWKGRLTESTDPINALVCQQYPPAELENVPVVMRLFALDDRITQEEWDYAFATPPNRAGCRSVLKVRDHGGAGVREKRFFAALERELETAKPDRRLRALKQVLPTEAAFLLDVEPRLPAELRAELDWTFFADLQHRVDDDATFQDHQRLLERMRRALSELPRDPKDARSFCSALSDRLELLEEWRLDTRALDGLICTCLDDVMQKETLSLVNKSELYTRALRRELPCVRPK